MDLKVGSIVKYGDNKRGIIQRVFEKTVWISGKTIPKTEIKDKIKDVEIGDILILEMDGEVLNEVILAEHIKEEIEGEGVYHYFIWDNIKNGRITWGQNQPLEYIRVPKTINNVLKDIQYKPNKITIPTEKEILEFNKNILDQNLKIGQVVAFADKTPKMDAEGMLKTGATDCYYRDTAGIGVIKKTITEENGVYNLEIAGREMWIEGSRIKQGKPSDKALIYPVKNELSKGDVVACGDEITGVVFNIQGDKVQIYNKDEGTILWEDIGNCELLQVSNSERSLILKLCGYVQDLLEHKYEMKALDYMHKNN